MLHLTFHLPKYFCYKSDSQLRFILFSSFLVNFTFYLHATSRHAAVRHCSDMYKRIYNWITKNDGAEEAGAEKVVRGFHGFPMEMYAEVFQYLDVQSLKNCKRVCRLWDMVLSRTEILCQNSIYAWNGNEMSIEKYTKCQWTPNAYQIETIGLRMNQFQILGFGMVSGSIRRSSFLQCLTHVELFKTEFLAAHLTEMVSKLGNLNSLDLNGARLFDLVLDEPPTPDIYRHWEKIKKLRVYIAETWELNALHGLTVSIFGTYCTRLENLTFKMLDIGERLIDQMRPFQNVFTDFHNTVHSNASTLKTVTLETFNIDYDRDDKFCVKNFEGVEEGHNYTFQWFLTRLGEHTDWAECGLRLENLTLRFRLANTRNTQAQTVFLPFLRTQTALEKFNMAQLYLPIGENTLESILNCLPPFCYSVFEGVLTLRPPVQPLLTDIVVIVDGENEDEDEDDAENGGNNDGALDVEPVVQLGLIQDGEIENGGNEDGQLEVVAPEVPPGLNPDSDDEDSDGDDDAVEPEDVIFLANLIFNGGQNDQDHVEGIPPPVAQFSRAHNLFQYALQFNIIPPQEQPIRQVANHVAAAKERISNEIVPLIPVLNGLDLETLSGRCGVVELRTALTNLTLRFIACRSLDDLNFLNRNIRFLTKIKIQENGIKPQHRIVVGDAEIQRIIKSALNLKDLWLEFCDLDTLTDFGLTGIAPGSCQRMLVRKDFGLRHGDFIGAPISAIRNLRSLKLSNVANQVTDVSAFHAFNGLQSMTHFEISKPMMTCAGLKKIRELFKFNQVIQFDPTTKILMDQSTVHS